MQTHGRFRQTSIREHGKPKVERRVLGQSMKDLKAHASEHAGRPGRAAGRGRALGGEEDKNG